MSLNKKEIATQLLSQILDMAKEQDSFIQKVNHAQHKSSKTVGESSLVFHLKQLQELVGDSVDINEQTNRFLRWTLPESVCADGCACIRGYPNRSGTNLLTFEEAKKLIEYLAGQE